MRVRRRNAALAVSAAVAAILAVAGIAWACTAQVGLGPLTPLAGPPGSKVTVKGLVPTAPEGGPVEIRWAGVKGPLLATAIGSLTEHGTEFSADITVPDVSPGIYSLLVVSSSDAVGVGRATFQVVGSGASPASERAVLTATAGNPWASVGDTGVDTSPVTSTPAFTAGMILLSVGMVGIVAGFGVAAVRRRRPVAVATTTHDASARSVRCDTD